MCCHTLYTATAVVAILLNFPQFVCVSCVCCVHPPFFFFFLLYLHFSLIVFAAAASATSAASAAAATTKWERARLLFYEAPQPLNTTPYLESSLLIFTLEIVSFSQFKIHLFFVRRVMRALSRKATLLSLAFAIIWMLVVMSFYYADKKQHFSVKFSGCVPLFFCLLRWTCHTEGIM